MIIFGASGHAKVILDIISSKGDEVIEYILDDDLTIDWLEEHIVDHNVDRIILQQKDTIIAVGNNKIRERINDTYKVQLSQAVIHKTATISKYAVVKAGTVVMPGAVINHSAIIGKNSIINTNAIIEHDVILDKFVHISPGAVITGAVSIGEGTHVGAGASIIPGLKIGKWVTVGAGAVVLKDIPDYAVVVGNPGKIIKYNKD